MEKKRNKKTDKKKIDPKTLKVLKVRSAQKFGAYQQKIDNPSLILSKTTEGIQEGLAVFEEIEQDSQVYSDLETRKSKVLGCDWDIVVDSQEKADLEQARELKNDIAGIIDDILAEAQDSIAKGYAIIELFYAIKKGKVIIEKVKGHDQENFFFSPDWKLMMYSDSDQDGIEVNENRVAVFSFDSRKGNRYGRSLFTSLFWPWFMKKHSWLFWSVYIEKYVQPTPTGLYPPGTTEEGQENLLASLEAIQNDYAIAIPNNFTIEFLEASRSGSIDSYEKFITFCDKYISKVILGAPLTTNEAQFGTRAQSVVHEGITEQRTERDAKFFAYDITIQVVQRLAQWNYSFTVLPEYVLSLSSEDTSLEAAQRDATIQQFLPLPLPYIYEKYNIPYPTDNDRVSYNGKIKLFGELAAVPNEKSFSENVDPKNEMDELAKKIDDYITRIYNYNKQKIYFETVNEKALKKIIESKDYKGFYKELQKYQNKAASSWEKYIILARLLGEYSVSKQIESFSNSFAEFEGDWEVLEPKDAIKWLREKIPVLGEDFKLLEEKARRAAFTSAGIQNVDLMNYLLEKLTESLQKGVNYKAFQKQMFELYGVKNCFPYQETVWRNNISSAYAAQQEIALRRSVDEFPYWRYSAVIDLSTRADHAAMHNFVARYDDPVWAKWSPPNGHNCRCTKIIATPNDVDEFLGKIKPSADDPDWTGDPLDFDQDRLKDLLSKKEKYHKYLNGKVTSEFMIEERDFWGEK